MKCAKHANISLTILLLANPIMFVIGLRIQQPLKSIDSASDSCNHWVLNKDGSTDFIDASCNTFPKFDAHKFCTEQLQCSSMLMVGDSTMWQKFGMLMELLNEEPPNVEHVGNLNLYNPHNTQIRNYTMKCGLKTRRPVCRQSCGNSQVFVSYMRHDHLNGRKYGEDKKSQCDDWKDHMKDFTHLVLGTGAHVGDHPELTENRDNVWDSRARELFELLWKAHPQNVVWTPAYTGLPKYSHECPDQGMWKEKPLHEDEIDTNMFGGSWLPMSRMNKVYKDVIKEFLPKSLIWDSEKELSMRGDCRKDFIHLMGGASSPLAWQMRQLQQLMNNSKNN